MFYEYNGLMKKIVMEPTLTSEIKSYDGDDSASSPLSHSYFKICFEI